MSRGSALRVGLLARLDEFESHVAEVRGRVGGGRDSLVHALDMVGEYPDWIRGILRAVDEMDEDAQVDHLGVIAQHVVGRSQQLEDWFARGASLRIPSTLFTAVEESFKRLGLQYDGAVLSIGRADNLETLMSDVRSAFFGALPSFPQPTSLKRRRLAMIQVPRLEGGDGLWWPLVLGHELAHLKCLEGGADGFDVAAKLNWQRFEDELGKTLTKLEGNPNTIQHFKKALDETAAYWLVELLCDAYAVASFGPAGAAALTEFLDTNGDLLLQTRTHPPGLLRVKMARNWARNGLAPSLRSVLKPSSEIATGPLSRLNTPHYRILAEAFEELGSDIWDLVISWTKEPGAQPLYISSQRRDVLSASIRDLRMGVPPTESHLIKKTTSATAPPDVINAGWVVREEAVGDNYFPVGELVTKALDSLDFVSRWQQAGGSLLILDPSISSHGATGHTVLTKPAILGRMAATDSDHRLVIAPCLADSVQPAAVDIRLGTRFIAFRRSLVPSVKTRETIRVEAMQNRIEVAWGSSFTLHPQELALAATMEYVAMPSDLSAQVITRSSYGRLGLITATAVQVHPWFRGCLTLELLNLGRVPLEISPGERIAQLVFSTVEPPVPAGARSSFGYSTWPEFSKARVTAFEQSFLAGMANESDE